MKALFFDIDGTLNDIRTHRVPQSAAAAIAEARRNGNMIFIATGRSHTIVRLNGLPEELIDGYITLNGAVCIAGKEFVALRKIPAAAVERLSHLCIGRGYTCLFVTLDGMRVANSDESFRTGFQEYFGLEPIAETDFKSMEQAEVYQMTVFFDEATEKELKPQFPELEFNRWFPTFADITACGVDKAAGIDSIIAHYGIDLADTVSFGDGGNDIPMLRHTAIGVAMGNASEDVKRNAIFVTDPTDRNGIANALSRLNLTDPLIH